MKDSTVRTDGDDLVPSAFLAAVLHVERTTPADSDTPSPVSLSGVPRGGTNHPYWRAVCKLQSLSLTCSPPFCY